MKRKLILEEWLSADGHVADKAGKLDFFTTHVLDSYTTAHRMEMLDSIDTILFGRKTYEFFSVLWPERPADKGTLAGKINPAAKVVFSGSLQKAPWGQWPEATIEAGDPAGALEKLKSQPGKNMVLWGSISLAQTFIAKNLVDEYHLHICPTITGGGRKLFDKEIEPIGLSITETVQLPGGAALLKFSKAE